MFENNSRPGHCTLSVKRIETRHNGITGNKVAGQRHDGYEITYTFTVAKKREPGKVGWHL